MRHGHSETARRLQQASRLGWALFLAAAAAAAAGPALAQVGAPPPPNFPTALDHDTLLAWLKRETDILPERVVAVTPQALTAIVSTFPGRGTDGPRAVIRAEALNAETLARTGALSWHVSLTADCAGRRVKLGDTTGYPERNLLGERRILRAAETEWRSPEAGTALESALRAACERNFRGPFAADASASPVPAPAEAPPPASASPAVTPAPAPAPAKAPAPSSSVAKAAPAKAAPAQAGAPLVKRAPPSVPTMEPPTPAAAPPAPAQRSISVQLGSYPDRAEAQAAFAKLPAGQTRSLEEANVGGKTRYRLVVWGFASQAEAQAYCDKRKAAGGACLVRAAPRN